ncbi:MAG: DNA primase [Pseudomonadota bacterium]
MSGRIPQSFINDLIDRTDIVALIDERVPLKKAGKNYSGLCPFHDEKTPSFSVSPDKQFYHCFGCGASGTALTFLMEYDRLEFVPAVEFLANRAGVEVQREGGGPSRPLPDKGLFEALEKASSYFQKQLRVHQPAIDYLRGRGLTGIVARDFGLGYAPEAWDSMTRGVGIKEKTALDAGLLSENDRGRRYDRFRNRVMFPIRDTRGRIIGFGGRVLGDGEPKYLNSPETEIFHKGQELYGLFEARQALRQIDELIVVEGYMDVIALAQAGIPNAVASLGTATSTTHFEKLYRFAPTVVCCFDGDRAGRAAAWKALQSALPTLKDGRRLNFMFLPDGEDPDTLVRKEGVARFRERAGGALSALDYLFENLRQGLDLESLDGRARLGYLATPLIEQVPAGLLRDLLRERLASLMGTSADRLAPAAKTAPPADVPPKPAPARNSRLTERLLGLLLAQPDLAQSLEETRLQELRPLGGILVEVIDYLRGGATGEPRGTAEALGYFADRPEGARFSALANRVRELPPDDPAAEFAEGLDSLLKLRADGERRRLLAAMREDGGGLDELGRYWEERKSRKPTPGSNG